jgi:hypothetical protein
MRALLAVCDDHTHMHAAAHRLCDPGLRQHHTRVRQQDPTAAEAQFKLAPYIQNCIRQPPQSGKLGPASHDRQQLVLAASPVPPQDRNRLQVLEHPAFVAFFFECWFSEAKVGLHHPLRLCRAFRASSFLFSAHR